MFRHTLRSGVCQWVELWTRDLLSFSFLWPAVWPSTAGTCRTGDSRRRPGQDTNRDSESSKTLYQSNTPKSAGFGIPSSSLNQTKKNETSIVLAVCFSCCVFFWSVGVWRGLLSRFTLSLSLSLSPSLFLTSLFCRCSFWPWTVVGVASLSTHLYYNCHSLSLTIIHSYVHALILCPVRHGRVDSRLSFDVYVGAPLFWFVLVYSTLAKCLSKTQTSNWYFNRRKF